MKRFSAHLLALALVLSCAISVSAASQTAAPTGLYVCADGSVLITDTAANTVSIRKGDKTELLAGFTPSSGGADGYLDADALHALFAEPWAIVPFMDGYAVSDASNNVVRYIVDGTVRTLAGSGKAALQNGTGKKASFDRPTGLAVDEKGNLYVADTLNNVIRRITTKGAVSTYAGGSEGCADGALREARFRAPTGLCWYDGALYICDSGNHRVCVLRDGKVSTVAGFDAPLYEGTNKRAGDFVDGKVKNALFDRPCGIAVTKDAIYVADTGNAAIRKIANGEVVTLLERTDDLALYPAEPVGISVVENELLIADAFAGSTYTAAQSAPKAAFGDVAVGSDLASAVDFVYSHGLFNGVSATEFAPQSPMTRAMFVTVFSRLYHNTYRTSIIKGSASFADVQKDMWYTSSVSWGADNALVKGVGENRFAPDGSVTHEQMAAFLYRYAALAELPTDLSGFADAPEGVSDWASDAVRWAIGSGIMTDAAGMQTSVTRGEVAHAFHALCEL